MKIIFASDWAAIRHFASQIASNSTKIYGNLLPVLQQADYRIVNLETPLYNGDFITKSGAAFTSTPESINSLLAVPFNCAILANNHTFDCGNDGFFATVDLLKKNNISTVGAGKNLDEAFTPVIINESNQKIAIFAISEAEDMKQAISTNCGVAPWNIELLSSKIKEAKEQGCFIIVSAHCGLEYQPYPSYYVRSAFAKLAESGANIIVGHHPHVPQGMTMFGSTPAYFSMGNFVFYQPVDFFYRKLGYMVEMEIDDGKLTNHNIIPYRISDDGLSLLENEDLSNFKLLFDKLSSPLQSDFTHKEAWNAVLAYNGVAGFQAELENILSTFKENPKKGAAMLRNRVNCIQHSSQWTDGFTRIIDDTIALAPQEYINVVKDYMTKKISNKVNP
jgi:poly-gamma-glutamate synthesis protein (capsule biosynthesis protein)